MDLRITIEDEDGEKLMNGLTIYQDGSDAGGVAKIKHWLKETFHVEQTEDELSQALKVVIKEAIDILDNDLHVSKAQNARTVQILRDTLRCP